MNDVASPKPLPRDADAWLARVATLAPAIEAAAPESERRRRLPDSLMAKLHEAGLFRLLLPRDFAGAEIALSAFFQVIEELAKHDASTAWCVCQNNGCAAMAAYLEPAVAEAIWGRDPRAVLAWGPGKAEARAVDGGYSVSARCTYVSGGRHANWFGAHCTVFERDGSVRRRADGGPELRTVLFPAHLAPMTDNWDVIGLRGTGSDAFEVKDLFVPEDHTGVREWGPDRRAGAPLYQFSFMGIYAIGFAAVALGIARAFIDAFLALAPEKLPRVAQYTLRDNPVVHDEVARAEARISAGRAFIQMETERVWGEVVAAGEITVPQRMRIRLAGTHAIHEAKSALDTLYETAGTSAIFAATPFERRFRDMHTVVQQIQGRKANFQTVGAWMLGHPADFAVI
jgi:alkylation response protein AidB-like acyl-CoA dehydrogenase